MIITVTLNPALDKILVINDFKAGSVNRVSRVMMEAGGKGINVSKTILAIGSKSKALGILAGQSGSFIEKSVDDVGIYHEFVFVDGETRTNVKISDPIHGSVTDINEPGPLVTINDIEKIEGLLFRALGKDDIVVFTGSVPLGVDKGIYRAWIEKANGLGARCILDADGELLQKGIEAAPYIVKPNINELERLYSKQTHCMEDIIELAKKLLDKGIKIAVVSLGENGSIFISKEWTAIAEGVKTTVKSTVGAGDAMVAALSYGLHEGLELEAVIKLAAACGTAAVMTYSTQPSKEHIEEVMKNINVRFL